MRQDRAAEGVITRWSNAADSRALAEIHAASWRYAYAGIIPGAALERAVSRRGPAWWGRMHARGFHALMLDCDGIAAGYATLGRCRSGSPPWRGEIYELYLRPEYHGTGLGRRLFEESRTRLRRHGLGALRVWALAENSVACRFYAAMGGVEFARADERFAGAMLQKVGFAWR